jgi:spermidine synthase
MLAGMAKAKKTDGAAEQERVAGPRDRLVGLKVLVVIAGAVLMALEIAGSRLLAPHFGNSVFVWGSLISVFLAALSLGYWAGGLLADRHPTWGLLGGICVGAAALIFLVPVIGHPTCRTLANLGLDDRTGPLAAAAVLFLPPSFLIGMVSPFAVRLAARSVDTIGRESGTLYALSTFGSIVGTLLTTFVLIPELGILNILRGLAVAMLLLPVILLLDRRRGAPLVPAVIVAIAGLVAPGAPAERLQAGERLVLSADTPYHGIQVVDFEEMGIRALKFDRFVESSILLEPPWPTSSEYTNYFHLAYLVRPKLRHVAFVGAGGGIGPRTFAETDPETHVDVVDVDPRVLQIAEEHFHMETGPRLVAHAADGRMWLVRSEGGFDCLVLDAFTIGGRIPFHLATREAFELMRSRLGPGGVFVMNTNSSLDGANAEIFRSIAATLQEVFPSVQAFAHEWRFDRDPERSRNVIFIASDAELPSPSEWLSRAARFVPRSSVSRETMIAMAADQYPIPDVAGAPVLTDDHAPIETMRF